MRVFVQEILPSLSEADAILDFCLPISDHVTSKLKTSIVDEVQGMLDGPDCISGYRHVWHSLQLKGLQVPRRVVEIILCELDPDGCRSRKGHKLKRRGYQSRTKRRLACGRVR